MTLPPPSRSPLALVALALVAGSLGACRGDRVDTTGSLYPHDVRTRHPYVLSDGPRTLDVFPTGTGHIDPRQTSDVEAFLLEFRRYGRGTLVIEMPRGVSPGLAPAVERTGGLIRSLGMQTGIPAGAVVVSGYPVANPLLAAPVRLSFQRMEAKAASQCGLWPQDLGTSEPGFDLRNEPYWNHGCSVRANIAAQAADPVDLVRGRGEGRIDTVRRVKVINKLRDGNDPSTTWRQDGSANVGSQVSGN